MTPLLIIEEHQSPHYAPRTIDNAKNADLTVAVAVDFNTHGEKLTINVSHRFCCIPWGTSVGKSAAMIVDNLRSTKGSTLNIAGNGIYTFDKWGVSQEHINLYMYKVLEIVNSKVSLTGLRSGGQTGMDMAGLVAGYALKIPTTGLLPNGFKQRYHDGRDITQTKEQIEEQVIRWASMLK
jgi:hypothetical protein